MTVTAILSQKGGVGKTITAANLASALAEHGQRVLLVDFDPQGDLSSSWGVSDDQLAHRIEDALADVKAPDPLDVGRPGETLALVPASRELRAQTARLLHGDMADLARLLAPLEPDFDHTIIDTPAGETVFGAQAIRAASETLVPLLPGWNEIRALHRILDDIDAQADDLGTDLGLLGVLLVNVDPRWKSTREYQDHLHAEDVGLLETIVPRRIGVAAHARHGRPTFHVEPDGAVAHAYRSVAREILGRLHADG
ncbi:MAG TPA: ParA family protein [Solirubrobacteraceae bacterium]|nr:ParA family protein [Solirubrobacteraceae bacterium]